MYISKRKNGYYFIEHVDQTTNRIRRKSTKSKIKKEAIRFLKEFETHLNSTKTSSPRTLSEFAVEYSEFIRNTFSKKYLSSVQLSFRKMIEHLGDIKLQVISTKDTQEFLTETHQRIKRVAELFNRTLKAAFNRAIEWEYIDSVSKDQTSKTI